ncbi:RNA 2',3'-cyclic phosphodiesterase [Sporichthya sp.]|uniref:RNA 2',3'-cyclic phosphodiesterase n=1 Tax=Sporichthya sp. TaxID=65475 RepID=UPI00184358F6|nr:RNA 2',3'-cyclic phosphodiesterase [Sporichthya sp.]MBA3744998.1 RNA 2',3'-cyclic phosphodiesterase [Sporichthya sp.]
MRLFVSISPPAEALDALDAELGPTRSVAPHGLRWTRPEQWHLTLAFLGEVPDADVPALTDGLAAAVGEAPISLRLAGGGCFGDRVLWVGLAGDVHALRTLAESTGGAAAQAGVALEDAAFRPHLTLARAGKERADLRPAATELAQVVGPAWDVQGVHLMHSRLGAGPGGSAAHEPIATWPRRQSGGR